MYIYIYKYIYIHIYLHVYVYAYDNVYSSIYKHTNIYTYTYIDLYVYMYTYQIPINFHTLIRFCVNESFQSTSKYTCKEAFSTYIYKKIPLNLVHLEGPILGRYKHINAPPPIIITVLISITIVPI
jgi:hypothetical protein